MFSVLILTLNEEKTLPSCLASLRGCDDVVVLDSGSTDRTAAIAAAAGARVVVHPFENFAQQRNFAHEAIEFRHPWVLHLDADEQLTEELRSECAAHTASEPVDGCYAAPRMLWEGRWIPHSTDYPAWQARFVKARGFTFVQAGHGQREAPQMRMDWLRANYLHNLSADEASGWLDTQKPTYVGKSSMAETQIQRHYQVVIERLASPPAETAPYDADLARAENYAAAIKSAQTIDALNVINEMPELLADIERWKTARPDLLKGLKEVAAAHRAKLLGQ